MSTVTEEENAVQVELNLINQTAKETKDNVTTTTTAVDNVVVLVETCLVHQIIARKS